MSVQIPDDELTELWRLEAEARPGPWECNDGPWAHTAHDGTEAVLMASGGQANETAALMVAARNSLPGIRARLERAEERVRMLEEQRESLREQVAHHIQVATRLDAKHEKAVTYLRNHSAVESRKAHDAYVQLQILHQHVGLDPDAPEGALTADAVISQLRDGGNR